MVCKQYNFSECILSRCKFENFVKKEVCCPDQESCHSISVLKEHETDRADDTRGGTLPTEVQ